jgi:hypothetical protein
MAVQGLIFGNASALAADQARHVAGAASAVLGVAQAVAMAVAAPLASSGGAATAVPMIWVMIAAVVGSLFAYFVLARPSADRTIEPSPTDRGVPVVHQYLVVANHTLGGQELLNAISDRMSRGPAEFWVLVPATPTPISSTTSMRSAAPSPPTSTKFQARPKSERATNALLRRVPPRYRIAMSSPDRRHS